MTQTAETTWPFEYNVEVTRGVSWIDKFTWQQKNQAGEITKVHNLDDYLPVYQVRESVHSTQVFLEHSDDTSIIIYTDPPQGRFDFSLLASRTNDMRLFEGRHDLYMVARANPNQVLHFFTGTFKIVASAIRLNSSLFGGVLIDPEGES